MKLEHFLITCVCLLSCSVMSSSLKPHGLQPTRFLFPWNFISKNTGAGSHLLLQGIFPTQRLNPHICVSCNWPLDSLPLSHLGSVLTSYTKVNSKWIKDLNVRPETIKLLEENISRTFFDINHSKILYDSPPRNMTHLLKINKWNLIKLKIFCTAKEAINKMKRQYSEWEKIIAN